MTAAAALGRPSIPASDRLFSRRKMVRRRPTRREPNWALLDEQARGGSKITDAELNATKKNYASATLQLAASFLYLEVINLLLHQKQSDLAFCSFVTRLPKYLQILGIKGMDVVAFDDQVVRRSSSVAHLLCVRPEGPAGLCPKLTLFTVLPGRGRSEARSTCEI